MSSALVSTSTIPFRTSLTWHSMAKAADCVARTSRQGARFRLIDVTTTDRKVPSSKGPKFRDMPSVIIPWLTKPPTLKLRKIPKLMLSDFDINGFRFRFFVKIPLKSSLFDFLWHIKKNKMWIAWFLETSECYTVVAAIEIWDNKTALVFGPFSWSRQIFLETHKTEQNFE